MTGVVYPVIVVFLGAAGLGIWSWAKDESSDPPGLKVHAAEISGCGLVYANGPRSELRRDGTQVQGDTVPVSSPDHDPWELPITLQAKTDAAIVVNGIDVKVLDSNPPPRQGTVVTPDGCGGVMTQRSFDVNLDAEQPSAKPSTKGPQSAKKPADFPLKVSAGDPEQLVLRLGAQKHDVRFAVTVKWISEGKTGSVTLDNGGAGYRVTGPGRLPKVYVTKLPE